VTNLTAMKKICLLFSVLVIMVLSANGAVVPGSTAARAALRFIEEKSAYASEAISKEYSVRETISFPADAEALYYICNLSPQGWIIISADDAVVPVLAYSFEGSYSVSESPVQCAAWMRQYEDQVRFARESNTPAFPYTSALWSDLLIPRPSSHLHRSNSVAPLITSNWNQNFPYNAGCPADPAGPGGHAYAGCVPTCMGQVMYYFRWPDMGSGSYSYYDSTYGTLSAQFDTTHYYWNQMTDVTNDVNPAIALLLYHLGVSCDLVYGPGGSGMYNHKAAFALRTFFRYSPQTQYVFRDSTVMNWDSILISHLDRKIPMYYAGWSDPNIDGHAFVCDGYQDSCYFHFNFGWSGQNNGYFYTSDLTPGGYNFQLAQEVIINCYPDTSANTYPPYCSGATDLKYLQGTFGDGSGPVQNYLPNNSCSWLIDPQTDIDSVSTITLNFVRFSTNPGDDVKIYDGSTTDAPLIATLSGDTIPPAVTSTGNRMLVTFNSWMGPGAPGFFAGYTSKVPVWCSGTTEIVADTAVITDGSFGFNYHNGQLCKWKVSTASGGPLTLNFHSFDTEEGKDFVKIYDFSNSTMVAQISGHYEPDTLPPAVTVEGGTAFIIFNSGSSVTGKGWEIYYPKSTEGIGEKDGDVTIRVYPNPAEDILTVAMSSQRTISGTLKIINTTGNVVHIIPVKLKTGGSEIPVDVSKNPAGIYIIQFEGEEGVGIAKFVKL
jgi:hypothetical protein